MLKPIPNHRQYSIDSETAEVYRTIGGKDPNTPIKRSFRKVKGKEYPNGYYYVNILSEDYELKGEVFDLPTYKPTAVHRLMALTFLEPPSDKHIWVNHKDGNKLNNTLNNLEWTTPSENIQHSFDVLGRKVFTGKDHWLYGNKPSYSTRKAMSDQKKGEKHPKFKGYYYINGRKYTSMRQAGLDLSIPAKTIANRIKRNVKGYDFVPKTP